MLNFTIYADMQKSSLSKYLIQNFAKPSKLTKSRLKNSNLQSLQKNVKHCFAPCQEKTESNIEDWSASIIGFYDITGQKIVRCS